MNNLQLLLEKADRAKEDSLQMLQSAADEVRAVCSIAPTSDGKYDVVGSHAHISELGSQVVGVFGGNSRGPHTAEAFVLCVAFYDSLSNIFSKLTQLTPPSKDNALRQSSVFRLVGLLGRYEGASALTRELIAQAVSAGSSEQYRARVSAAIHCWEALNSDTVAAFASLSAREENSLFHAATRDRLLACAELTSLVFGRKGNPLLAPGIVSDFVSLSS